MKAVSIDLSIQIVNYHSRDLLVTCLSSVLADLKNSELSYVIKIIDNASGDDLSALKTRFSGSKVKFYQSKTNRGFGAGHNYLFSQIPSSTHTLVLNPDTKLIEEQTLLRLVTMLEHEPRRAVVGPALITSTGERQYWDHGELRGWKARIAALAGGSYYRRRDIPGPVAWVSGAALLVRSSDFGSGFDEAFFLFKEEEDLCLRLRRSGKEIYYDPCITIQHLGGGSGAAKSDAMQTSTELFNAKHFNPKSLITKVAVYLYQKYQLWE